MNELRESATEQPLKDASHKEKVEMDNTKLTADIENDDLLEKIEEVINDKKSDAVSDVNQSLQSDKEYLDQLDNVENENLKVDCGDSKPTSTTLKETNCDGKDDKNSLKAKDDVAKDTAKPNNLSDSCNLSNDLKDDTKCKKSDVKEPENNGEATADEADLGKGGGGSKAVPPTVDQAANVKPSENTNEDKSTNKTVEQIKENSEVDFVKPPEVLDGGGDAKEKIFGITKGELVVQHKTKSDVAKPSDKKETTPAVNDVAQKEVNELNKENDEKMSVDDAVENANLDAMDVDGEEKMDVDLENELLDEEMKTVDVEENPKKTQENAVVEKVKEKQKGVENEVIEIDDKNDDDLDDEDNKTDEKEVKEIESINLDELEDSKDKVENLNETRKVELNKNVQKTNNLPPETKDKDVVKETVKIDDDQETDDDVVEIIEDDESPKEGVKESQTPKETSSSAPKKPETKEEQASESKKAISENIKNSEQEGTKTQAQSETTTSNHKTEEKTTVAAADEPGTGEKVETKEESSQTTGPASSTKKESDASVSSSSEAVKKEKDDKKSVEKNTEKQEQHAEEEKPKAECLDNVQFNGVHISIENCTYEVTIVSDKNGFKSLSLERHDATDSNATNKTESTDEKITKNKFVSIVGLRQFIKDFYSSVDDKSDINEPFTPTGKDGGPRSGNRKRTETPKAANAKSKARKRSLNVDDESEKRMKLSTPPPQQDEPSVEVESPKILAKWVDKTFYPGKIVETKPGNKYVVVFVDGQTKTVRKDSIIFTGDDGNLPLKDQVVHVMIDNNYEAGVVEAMEKDENNKMIYTVVTDNNTVKVPLSDICVKEDVAKTIQSRSSISLDDSETTKSPASKRKSVRNSTEPGCSGVESTKGRRRQNRYS